MQFVFFYHMYIEYWNYCQSIHIASRSRREISNLRQIKTRRTSIQLTVKVLLKKKLIPSAEITMQTDWLRSMPGTQWHLLFREFLHIPRSICAVKSSIYFVVVHASVVFILYYCEIFLTEYTKLKKNVRSAKFIEKDGRHSSKYLLIKLDISK